MRIHGQRRRTLRELPDARGVEVIDQRLLPHRVATTVLATADDAAAAIRDMTVRGAPLIGAVAAYGVYLALRDASDGELLDAAGAAATRLAATRPTAVNLRWALDRVLAAVAAATTPADGRAAALAAARAVVAEELDRSRRIGEAGLRLIREAAARAPGRPVNVLTHCNAGWLATIDHGTATAPIYAAHDAGIPLHVWVDETRPRNQGAALTAFELGEEGVPHTVIVDNAGGHLMQQGLVDLVLVGADRVAANGDVANKIGTYLKALAARDNGVPFYVALPSSTLDATIPDGAAIPIEERDGDEVRTIAGLGPDGPTRVLLVPPTTPARNWGFDVTPARLITGFITEFGVHAAGGLAAALAAAAAARRAPRRAVTGETGYILFRCTREEAPPPAAADVAHLIHWRQRLRDAGLIGVLPDGIGYGNLSCRAVSAGDDIAFVVSGTATGGLPTLGPEHFALVTAADIDGNALTCRGHIDASSESLTHAAIYRADPGVRAVVHVHDAGLWRRLHGTLPTTPTAALAGTPAIARAVAELLHDPATRAARIIVMGGHPDGLLGFGPTIADTATVLLDLLSEGSAPS
jgi:methylthioribose-1-phosphate isomerase